MAYQKGGNVTSDGSPTATYVNPDLAREAESQPIRQNTKYRPLRVYGKEIIEKSRCNVGGVTQIVAFKLEDGTVLSATEVFKAYQQNQTEGLQIVTGSTTDSLVIKSVKGYAKTPLSQLPNFY